MSVWTKVLNSIPLQYFKFILLAVIIFHLGFTSAYAQVSSIEQAEAQLKNQFGLEKLKVLNEITLHYYPINVRKALRYGKQAVSIGENIFDDSNTNIDRNEAHHLVRAYLQLGKVHYSRENYFESKENLLAAQALSARIKSEIYSDEIEMNLKEIDALDAAGKVKQNFFSKTLGDLNVGEVIGDASKDIAIETEIKLGQSKEKNNAYQDAIDHYEKAINLLKNRGKSERIKELQLKIAVLLDKLDQHEKAQEFLSEAITEIESGRAEVLANPPRDTLRALEQIDIRPNAAAIRTEQKNLKDLADSYAREKNFEKSLVYYKLYEDLTQKVEADSLKAVAIRQQNDQEILLLKQQKNIADLSVEAAELEKDRQIRLRNTSILIGLLILLGTLLTLFFYFAKRREHKKLTIAYRDLDKTKGKLVGAEQRIVKLLRQQVSGDVAQELLMNSFDKPGERLFVCIMFLDIRDFTPMAEKLSPEELIRYQNDVFGFMIDVVQQHQGNINQLLGDGFMATFGAPVSHGNDCQNAFLAAKEILKEVKERSDAGVIPKTKIGIGLHAGFVVTGNVGNEARKQYSVTGNSVIIASRVEQLNKEYKTRLIITEEVYQKLDKPLQLDQPFLEVEIKGRSNPVRILKIA